MVHVSDLATAAEKLMSWPSEDASEVEESDGPYLCTGSGGVDINSFRPLCLRLSLESSVVASFVLGKNPPVDPRGGVRIPVLERESDQPTANTIIARSIIIEQFEIFKEFATCAGVPFNLKSAKTYEGISSGYLTHLVQCINRRNELAHYDQCDPPSIQEGVQYYVSLRQIAGEAIGMPELMIDRLSYKTS